MRKKGFRILSVCAVMIAAMLSLTACHGSKGLPEFQIPDTFDTTSTYEITFWAKNDSNKSQVNVYKKAIADFESLYPNIKINLRQYTDYSRLYNDVITNISTNTTPNVCITYPDHIATYRTGCNVVLPLDELIADSRYGLGGSEVLFDSPTKDEVIPEFLQEGVLDDVQYALPFMRSTEACYINQDLVQTLGYEVPDVLTWDFVFEVSEKAMEKDADGTFKINGQKVLIPFIYKSTDNMMISMLKQQNAGYSTTEGTIDIFNDTTRDILLEISKHAGTGAFSTFAISSYPANFLNAGQCIFAVDSTAGATWMGADAPLADIAEESKVDFTTAIRPIPQYDTANIKMISQGPSLCVFNKENPQEVMASWLFAQFLLTNDVQTGYAQTEGYVPVTSKARNSQEYVDYLSAPTTDSLHYEVKMEATKLLLSHTADTFVTPVFNGSASLRSAAGALVENVTKAMRRKTTVDNDFISKQFDSVTSLYRLNQVGGSVIEKQDFGALPNTAVILLWCLCIAWILIIAYFIVLQVQKIKHK